MREYKIKETELWFIIYKMNDNEWFITVLYRNGKWRDSRRECAKEFLFKDEALSNLIIAKWKWNEYSE